MAFSITQFCCLLRREHLHVQGCLPFQPSAQQLLLAHAAASLPPAVPPQIKVSKAEATWQRQRGGRGGFAGRGPGRTLTTFGGGAGEVPGGYGPSGGRRVWGGSGSIAGRGGAGGAATKRLVKAGGAAVKAEPKDESMEDKESMEGVEAAAGELEELEFEDDPLSYDQYYPAMLPHRWVGVNSAGAQVSGCGAAGSCSSMRLDAAWSA